MKIFKRKKLYNKCYLVTHASPGCGATHLGLSIANYLSSALGNRVIYIELTKNSTLRSMVAASKPENISDVYSYRGVNYFLNMDTEGAREIILSANCPVIVDVESLDRESLELAGLCHRAIILGFVSPWNKEMYIDLLDKYVLRHIDVSKITFLGVGPKKEIKTFSSMTGLFLQERPIIQNPFSISENEFKSIEKLIV